MGPAQLAEVLRALPDNAHPDLLVGFETSDDAGVFRLSADTALVQTIDFFTPIVDDPYSYGAIAAANSLSDVYAMGGRPITAMNVACFDPTLAPAEVWAEIFRGMSDKCAEAEVAVVGGHSVEDQQPKFGLSVTGVVNPAKMFHNVAARPGDKVYLSKPLGTGIITTAAKFDDCPPNALEEAIASMSRLNREAAEVGVAAGCLCATDITGFALAGHLYNIARASGVSIEIDTSQLPLLPELENLVDRKNLTAGARNNERYLADALQFSDAVAPWLREVVLDPQTSGGLALVTSADIPEFPQIGRVIEGPPVVRVS